MFNSPKVIKCESISKVGFINKHIKYLKKYLQFYLKVLDIIHFYLIYLYKSENST